MYQLLHKINTGTKLKVCAYCRVSTDKEEQAESLSSQLSYFSNLIIENPNWQFAGIFADDGISGRSIENRDNFKLMMAKARSGLIDVILTKSVSRFARDIIGFTKSVRELREYGVEVYFEKENLSTLDNKSDLVMSIYADFAEEESRSISKNVSWRFQKQVQKGDYKLNTWQLIGYKKDQDGNIYIDEEEAKIVRHIFDMYITGSSISDIINWLYINKVKSPGGADKWAPQTVHNFLQNEKYVGDCRMQKTFIRDKHKFTNKGQVPSSYIENGHPAIIDRDTFNRAQELRRKRKEHYQIERSLAKQENHFLSTNPYTSFGYCPYCGKSYHIRTHQSKEYGTKKFYGDSSNKIGKNCMGGFNIYFDVFKEAVSKTLNALKADPKKTRSILEKEMSTAFLEKSIDNEINQINKEIAIIDDKCKVYEQSTSEYYSMLLNKAKDHKKELLEKRITFENEKITKCNSNLKVDEVMKAIKELPVSREDTENIDFRKVLNKAIMFEQDYIVFLIGDAEPSLITKDTPLFFEDSATYMIRKTSHILRFGIAIK